ncbi:MAG TPA: hypothetical protein VG474_10855 [Solirubrobacteraceae bacterium]|nr:hypothetical protein [Solirubrobacteraceae bacterium]
MTSPMHYTSAQALFADLGRQRRSEAPMSAVAVVGALREVDARSGDGLDVRLLWDPITDRMRVTVDDARTHERLELDVREDERALDVFRHPLAYAALRTP